MLTAITCLPSFPSNAYPGVSKCPAPFRFSRKVHRREGRKKETCDQVRAIPWGSGRLRVRHAGILETWGVREMAEKARPSQSRRK